MELDTETLKSFILEASKASYASGDSSVKTKEPDGSTTIEYESGSYRYHDNYFGGEPYGGREIVFLDDKPLWMMVYYGLVHSAVEAKPVYSFLMESLSLATAAMPYRGPSLHERGEFRYENLLTGDVDRFSGTEKIYQSDTCVYEASYIGGLVDQ